MSCAGFNYLDHKDGTIHQMWFDDPRSTRLKCDAAKAFGVGGVGPYEFSDLDYSGEPKAREETAAMWAVLGEFAQAA